MTATTPQSSQRDSVPKHTRRRTTWSWIVVALAVLAGAVLAALLLWRGEEPTTVSLRELTSAQASEPALVVTTAPDAFPA